MKEFCYEIFVIKVSNYFLSSFFSLQTLSNTTQVKWKCWIAGVFYKLNHTDAT